MTDPRILPALRAARDLRTIVRAHNAGSAAVLLADGCMVSYSPGEAFIVGTTIPEGFHVPDAALDRPLSVIDGGAA